MKRYTMKVNNGGCGCSYVKVFEFPNGEWVKWEDCNEKIEWLNAEIRRLKSSTPLQRTPEGDVYVKEIATCNCKQMANWRMPGDISRFMHDWWVCPAHGYKKR